MLKIKNISKVYESSRNEKVQALNNIDLDLNNNGFVSILGKSGSGKSTLLNLIGTLDNSDSGEIIVNNKSITKYTNSEKDYYRNTYLGFIFQDYNLLDNLTVKQNLAIGLELQGEESKFIDQKISKILKDVGLENYEKRYPNELSGGQKQRVAIARALVKKNKIILCDEPTGNLDSSTSKEILTLLKEISKDKLVIMVTHDEEFAQNYADRIITLSDGKIVSDIFVNDVKLEKVTDTENDKLIKSKMSHKKTLSLGMNILLRKKIRLLFSIFLFTFAISFLGLATIFTTYDSSKSYDESYRAENESKFIIENLDKFKIDSGSGVENIGISETQLEEMRNNNGNIDFLGIKSYETPFIDPSNFNPTVGDGEFYSTNIKNLVVLNREENIIYGNYPSDKNEILITDYLAELFISYNLFPDVVDEFNGNGEHSYYLNKMENLLTKKINIYDDEMTIVGIVKTDYEKFYKFKSSDVGYEYYEFNGRKTIKTFGLSDLGSYIRIIGNCYITKDYYDYLIEKESMNISAEINGYYYNAVNKIDNLADASITFGETPTADNEIALPITFVLGKDEDPTLPANIDRLNAQLDQEVEMKINSKLGTKSETKTVITKGFYESTENRRGTIIISEDSYNSKLNYNYDYVLVDTGEDYNGSRELFESLLNEGYTIYSPYSDIINQLNSIVSMGKTTLYILSFIFAIFAIILITTFLINNIFSMINEIGIYRSLGVRNKDISVIFMVPTLFITLLSVIFATILVYVYSYLINVEVSISNMYIIKLVNPSLINAIFISVFAILAAVIATVLPLIKINKMKPIDAIKSR